MKLLLLLLSFTLGALCAETVHLQFEPAKTKVAYTVDSTLHTVHGAFELKRGVIDYDTATGKASGEIVIDAASGKSGSDSRDSRMHKAVLQSAKFPEIKFMPDRVDGEVAAAGGVSEVKLHGQFLLHGATHEMTMTAKVRKSDGMLKTTSTFVVPYIQWGLKNPGNFMLKVSDKVEIHLDAEAKLTEQK